MFYEKLTGATAGAGLLYLLTGNFWATLFGGLFGCYAAEKLYDEPNQTASVKSAEQAYPEYRV